MTRRTAIRNGVLFALALALGKMDALKADGGQLWCPLDQWQQIKFTYRGKTLFVPVSEVFAALEEGFSGKA